ncbi:hypothetical protein BHE18_01965 [Rossellomorea aquimaris]|uniref:VanZ-like domain-containing protein n=1 Tax=Rossellomorea aquimaris TaxID=189382 RepID=A0A1J6VZD4_9BACI|nr:hypothetical protein BHE18_01965 [Rossellomorea aquimaris]
MGQGDRYIVPERDNVPVPLSRSMPPPCHGKDDDEGVIGVRWVTAISYLVLIFIFTCTEKLTRLYIEGIPRFRWNPEPDYSAFFDFTSYPFTSPAYIYQKAGHALAFCLLAAIVYMVVNRLGTTILISAGYALFTEVAQLFFYRTGCLLDVGFDAGGVVLYVGLYWLWKKGLIIIQKAEDKPSNL